MHVDPSLCMSLQAAASKTHNVQLLEARLVSVLMS